MSNQNSFSTEERILKFLRDYPYDPIKIVVGFASTWGLAWLHRNANARKIDLIIGNPKENYFDKASEEDRNQALWLLKRGKIELFEWKEKSPEPSTVNTKAWMIERQNRTAVLVGSANLTLKGFQKNQELMVEPSLQDGDFAIEKINKLFEDCVDCKDEIIQYVLNSNNSEEKGSKSNQTTPQASSAANSNRQLQPSQRYRFRYRVPPTQSRPSNINSSSSQTRI